MTKLKRPKIGLALGSGGARGLTHIGVIKILEENNIAGMFLRRRNVKRENVSEIIKRHNVCH